MRLWRFKDPNDERYAPAGRRGSWSEARGICPECTASSQKRTQSLILVWEPGSDRVGDFAWPGFGSEVVAAEHVFAALEASFSGFERGPIDMVEDPDYAGRRQVPLPYDGPALFELWTTAWASADVDRSAIRLDRRCGTCGMEFWERDGDLVVPREEPADIFRVTQFPAWVLCTNAVRDLVTEHGFTNVAFEAMGEVS